MDISLADRQKLEKLCEVFMEWNGKMNLSAIRDFDSIWEKHILDSLLGMEFFNFSDKKILDIGAGGGFPILPLSIMNSSSEFLALDSVGKKMKAVQDMADQLNLRVKTFHGRIEDFGHHKRFREKFDMVTARALAPWPVLLEYALPFVKVGGSFLAYQGPGIEDDLAKFKNLEKQLGGKVLCIEKTFLGTSERVFVEIKKIKPTSKKFPRENGTPRKDPLK